MFPPLPTLIKMPCYAIGSASTIEILRLRLCFASRNTTFAQDDIFMWFYS
jgi:hypothetical protein